VLYPFSILVIGKIVVHSSEYSERSVATSRISRILGLVGDFSIHSLNVRFQLFASRRDSWLPSLEIRFLLRRFIASRPGRKRSPTCRSKEIGAKIGYSTTGSHAP
jgi:hypothetical protein